MNHVPAESTTSLEVALAHASRLLASDPALAGEQAHEILKHADNHPQALLLLGVSHSTRGQNEQALGILSKLATQQPAWAVAQAELGYALARARRGEEAVAALRRAVALKPEFPQAWRALADHLAAIGDEVGADSAYAAHVRYSTRDPQLLAAATALYENRIPEAEALLRKQLKQAPTDVAAIRMLAEVAGRLGRMEDAEHLLQRCLELAPSFHTARHNYAQVLHRGNKPAQALDEINKLLALEPANPGYRNFKAAVLCRTGDYEEAIAHYDAVLADYPFEPRVWLSCGHALKTANHQDRAIQAYRRAVSLRPGFGEAWWSLANLKTFRFEASEIEVMRAQLKRADLEPEDRLHLEFALGKANEDTGEYAQAFGHYQQANALRRQRVPYDADDTSERMRRARQTYTHEFFEQRKGFGSDSPDPIFIVGMPRAGSTLIEQILSSHSLVEGTMELSDIISTARSLRNQGESDHPVPYHAQLAELDAEAVRALGDGYIQATRIHRKTRAPFFIDKMPNNFAHIGLIHLALPNAKIIDARRHPMACCFSNFKQHFARGQNFSYNLDDLGRYYSDYVGLMSHFDQVLPGRIHRVHYEQMVDDTEAQVRSLLDYCGLTFEPACLRFFENQRPVRTASSEQVRKPIYREGIDHWRSFEPWLGPLRAALGPVLKHYPKVPALDTTLA